MADDRPRRGPAELPVPRRGRVEDRLATADELRWRAERKTVRVTVPAGDLVLKVREWSDLPSEHKELKSPLETAGHGRASGPGGAVRAYVAPRRRLARRPWRGLRRLARLGPGGGTRPESVEGRLCAVQAPGADRGMDLARLVTSATGGHSNLARLVCAMGRERTLGRPRSEGPPYQRRMSVRFWRGINLSPALCA